MKATVYLTSLNIFRAISIIWWRDTLTSQYIAIGRACVQFDTNHWMI